MNFSFILGVGSFFFQLYACESVLKRRRKMFVRPCFSEDEPNLLTCSHPTEACDKETNDFRLVRLDASKVGYLKKVLGVIE